MKRFNFIFILTVLSFSNLLQSQSVFGKWKTIDDRTGNPKGIVNVYKKDGMLYGKIEKVIETGKESSVCIKCKGDLKNTAIVGMTIIKDGEMNDENEWKGKFLFDPEEAMTYRFKIWLNPDDSNELKVRGYWAFLYRTQTWIRVRS